MAGDAREVRCGVALRKCIIYIVRLRMSAVDEVNFKKSHCDTATALCDLGVVLSFGALNKI